MINILKLRKLQKAEDDISQSKEQEKISSTANATSNVSERNKDSVAKETESPESIETKIESDTSAADEQNATSQKDSYADEFYNKVEAEEQIGEIKSDKEETTDDKIEIETVQTFDQTNEIETEAIEEEAELEEESETDESYESETKIIKVEKPEIIKDDIIAKEIQISKEESKKESDIIQLVGFYLAGELYAIDITLIREIIRYNSPTRVPRAPKYVEGVINLRGQVLPVVNLRKKLNLPAKEHDSLSRIIVLDLKEYLVGFSVDEVKEVIRIPSKLTQPPPDILSVAGAQFVKAIANFQDNLILILDIEKALQHQKDLQK